MGEIEDKVKEFTDESSKKNGQFYLQTMKRVLEKGNNFVGDEIKRVEKLQGGKLSENKKEELGFRYNILHSFKDEL